MKLIYLSSLSFFALFAQEQAPMDLDQPLDNDEEQFESDQEEVLREERDVAETLANRFGLTIEGISQQRQMSPETIAQALLWISEHPSTPMPTTPLQFTDDQIINAADEYKNNSAKRKEMLNTLNQQEILRNNPGITDKELRQAFSYYKLKPKGNLPTTSARIQELSQKWQRLLDQRTNYTREKRRVLENLNKEEILENNPDINHKQLQQAFSQYKRKPFGTAPTTSARIEELSQKYQLDLDRQKGYHRKRRQQEKNRRLELEQSIATLPPAEQDVAQNLVKRREGSGHAGNAYLAQEPAPMDLDQPLDNDEEQFESDQEEVLREERDVAETLANRFGLTIEGISQQRQMSPETIAQALLWISEHPSTPMPTTPLQFTDDQIINAADEYKNNSAKRKEMLNTLNQQEILRNNPGISDKELRQAFSYYKLKPKGNLPNTSARIQELSQKWQHLLDQRTNYTREKRRMLENLNKEEILENNPDINHKQLQQAFSHYKQNPSGNLPTTSARIQELSQKYQRHLDQSKEYARKRRQQEKIRRLELEQSIATLPPAEQEEEQFESAQEEVSRFDQRKDYRKKKKQALENLNKEEILEKNPDINHKQLQQAFSYYKLSPSGNLPTTSARIQELSQKYQRNLDKSKEWAQKRRQKAKIRPLELEQSVATLPPKDPRYAGKA